MRSAIRGQLWRLAYGGLIVLASVACGDDDAGLRSDASADEAGAAVDAPSDGGGASAGEASVGEAGRPERILALVAPPHAYLGEEACFRLNTTLAFDRLEWFFGDGDRLETSEREVCHAYDRPGDKLVSVVLDAPTRPTVSERVLVVPRPAAVPPAYSSTVVFDPMWERVLSVNPDAATVAVIDAATLTRVAELTVGETPRTLALVGDRIAVACEGEGALRLFDRATLAPAGRLALGVGSRPYGVVADPRGERLVMTLEGTGEVATVRLASAEVEQRLFVGRDPRAIAMTGDGIVLVTRFRSDTAGGRVWTLSSTQAGLLELVRETELPVDVGRDSDTDNSGVPSYLGQIAITPDASRAFVVGLKANVVTGMYRTGSPLTSETTARAVLSELSITRDRDGGPAAEESYRLSFDDLDFASALAIANEGGRLYVAIQGAERVVVLDAFDFNVEGSIADVGSAPQGLALDGDRQLLFVQAFLSRALRVYDVADLSREPPLVAEVSTVAVEPLPAAVLRGKKVFYASRDPRMSRTSYLSCASCHLDGDADNLVWDFTQRGEGLRNTISLRGRGGTAHGALHWTGNFDEVQDFEHDIRDHQGGLGFLSDALFMMGTRDRPLGDPKAGYSPELDDLAAYLSSLTEVGISPFRKDGDPDWEAAFARGEALFASDAVGCAACHGGERFTDSGFSVPGAPALHDVGTIGEGSGGRLGGPLTGIDTPTLRGLFGSAPYLHDGSAVDLQEVLTIRNLQDRHGRTSHLSPSELDDLVTYLLAIDDRVVAAPTP